MTELAVLVAQVFAKHVATDGMCDECTHQWPCPEYRIADDWKRIRSDIIRGWKNRTGAELNSVRKYLCAGCCTKDTGLLCEACIEETVKEIEEIADETASD
jgi:hypothetical protein